MAGVYVTAPGRRRRRHTPGMPEATTGTLLRLAAFTTDPAGGNPAGVWIGDALPPDAEMQAIAAEVGYSETAFLAPDGSDRPGAFRVRYFSPLAEVPFCGHATIASGVALAERGLAAPPVAPGDAGRIEAVTNGGPVAIAVETGADGSDPGDADVDRHERARARAMAAVRRARAARLDGRATWTRRCRRRSGSRAPATSSWPPPGSTGWRRLDYPFEELKALMLRADLTTLQLVWRETPARFRARDPFPVGGVVEDPATGAAAAALGAYLRERGEIRAPASFEIAQGVEMGRPSRITVSIVPGEAGVRVSGNAVAI